MPRSNRRHVAPRRTLDETRVLILDASVELLAESAYAMSPAALSLVDACRRAGLSTVGSAYKIWPTQQLFRTDVVRHLLDTDTNAMFKDDSLVDVISQAGEAPSLSTLLRIVTNENAESTIGSPEFSRAVVVWCAAASDRIFEELFVAERRQRSERLVEMYGLLLEIYGLEMAPPYTISMLVTSIQSLLTGMSLTGRYDTSIDFGPVERPTGPDGALEQWHLFGCATEAVVNGLTRSKA